MSRGIFKAVACAVAVLGLATLATADDYRRCATTNFCYRNRERTHQVQYVVDNLDTDAGVARFVLTARDEDPTYYPAPLVATVGLLNSGAVYFRAEEGDVVTSKYGKRYDSAGWVLEQDALSYDATATITLEKKSVVITSTDKEYQVKIAREPFRIEHLFRGEVQTIINEEQFFNFEQHRDRQPSDAEEMWRESFGGWTDTKTFGPSALTVDVQLPQARVLSGLPEHTSGLALKRTRGADRQYDEPYRFYNVDAYGHPLDSPNAIYGAVPFLQGQGLKSSQGVFFLNPSEMYIDLNSRGEGREGYASRWIAESGVFQLFLFAGFTPADVKAQYHGVTGLPVMPPMTAMAYHQCRWNYMTVDDVLQVNDGFETNKIPMDVMWLDIDHTDSMKYFTWDPVRFADPVMMQKILAKFGRSLVTIIDPHIKVDNDYLIYKTLREKDLFVKDGDNHVFENDCWPGRSSWADFALEETHLTWNEFFTSYNGSTVYLHTWNDMNEPSVFTGPEKTMPKDALHRMGTLEHREIHNMYGFLYNLASAGGLARRQQAIARVPERVKPSVQTKGTYSVTPIPGAAVPAQRHFLLTRSFFAGSQRIGAVWTGDNQANWGYLKYSVPMLLNLGIGGITFAGADVGGFAGNPDIELQERWYQAAAFVPFYRAHSSNDTARREPWLYGEPHVSRIREAIQTRYTHLAYVATQFRIANATGLQPMRPLAYEFFQDPNVFATDDMYMMGDSVLSIPVSEPGKTSVRFYLPMEPMGARSVWYDSRSFERVAVADNQDPVVTLAAPPEYSPVLYRGGRIIPLQETRRDTSSEMSADPFKIVASFGASNKAEGAIYLDDGASYQFMKGHYVYRKYRMHLDAKNKAVGFNIDIAAIKSLYDKEEPIADRNNVAANLVTEIVILGLPESYKSPRVSATKTHEGYTRTFTSEMTDGRVIIRSPDLLVSDSLEIGVYFST